MSSPFHLHVDDARGLNPSAAERLISEFGFFEHHFSGHPEGYPHYEPTRHYTAKFDNGRDLRETYKRVCTFLADPYSDGSAAFHGYVEAEFIPPDRRIHLSNQPFNPDIVPLPRLELKRLPQGDFRETEFHLTCDWERSNREAVRRLLEMGLFGALTQKSWGTSIVLTAQGTRSAVHRLWDQLYEYLLVSGGLERATLKEERILWHWIAHPHENRVPPVIG
jgi:hypothetical protein